ncbi:hypothetical protein QCN27_06680 [Cereibacter sp. SYSU M97828]|nr:hypothetical protein [Cereibacter flavus]
MTLEQTLDGLIEQLRAGEIEALDGIAQDLETALATLGRNDAAALAKVRARAAEAASLLDAAGKGVRAARWRLAEIRAMGADGGRLVTYDGKGRRAEEGAALAMMQRL